MTKYILNSGGVSNNPELAKKFFAEIFKGLGSQPRLLVCLFSRGREYWDGKFIQEQENIPKLSPDGVSPILELAFPDLFEQQLKSTNALLIYGGDDHLLQYWLRKFDLPKIWDGKVVATSSAGSDAMVKYFWTCDWRENIDGLGILPIKFLPHFKSAYGNDDSRGPIDWDKAYEELKKYKEDLPIYALTEGEFVVIEK